MTDKTKNLWWRNGKKNPFKDKRHSKKSRKRMSELAKKRRGEKSPGWKGDDAGYHAIHKWLVLHCGKADRCEDCGNKKAKRYEWANLSGEYKRDRNDFKQLCSSCHINMDRDIKTEFWQQDKDVICNRLLNLTGVTKDNVDEIYERNMREQEAKP